MPTAGDGSVSSRNTDTTLIEGWLVKSREHGLRFPLLKSKWVRRYFALRHSTHFDGFVLDEFRSDNKRRLRKSLDMDRCIQVDSYLQLSDSSCTARGGSFQWIFSIYFKKKDESRRLEVYLVAESEEEMLKWVGAICRACRLEKQDSTVDPATGEELDIPMPLNVAGSGRGLRSDGSLVSTSLAGMSLSSNISSQSFDSTADTDERRKQKRDYMHINKFSSRTTPRVLRTSKCDSNRGSTRTGSKTKRNDPSWQVESSTSACSSVSGSRRSLSDEDESSSCVSSSASAGRELGPLPNIASSARSRLTSQMSTTSSSAASTQTNLKNQFNIGLNQPVAPPSPYTINESAENESSGETIKIHGIRRDFSPSGSRLPTYINGANNMRSEQPPKVDRSKKPHRLRPESDDDHAVCDVSSLDGSRRFASRASHLPALPKTTPKRGAHHIEAPKSAGPLSSHRSALDYFDPRPENVNILRHTRLPPPVEIEYIKIDAQKTQAVKQVLAQRGATVD